MTYRPSSTLANSVAPGVRPERIEPLLARVAGNRWRFLGFMVSFVLAIALFAAAVAGACLGFLWYNSYPADIFMGDTGSLGLGAAIAAIGVVTKTELLTPLIGGIYVAEGLSVILQVASFKLTGKRIFRMAPLHHHYEMKGWSETKVMVRFWIVTGIMAGAGFALWFVTVRPR